MGIIIGADNLIEMFEEKYYRNLNGGILEAFGIIFIRDVKIYLYPFIKDNTLLTPLMFRCIQELNLCMIT